MMNDKPQPSPLTPQVPYQRRSGGGRNEPARLAERIGDATKPVQVPVGGVTVREAYWMPSGRPAPFVMTSREVLEFLRVECAESQISTEIAKLRADGLCGFRVRRGTKLFLLPSVLQYIDQHVIHAPEYVPSWRRSG